MSCNAWNPFRLRRFFFFEIAFQLSLFEDFYVILFSLRNWKKRAMEKNQCKQQNEQANNLKCLVIDCGGISSVSHTHACTHGKKKRRDWFLYSIIVLLLHRCRTQSLTMDAQHKAHIHLEFMLLFFSLSIQLNKTNRSEKQQLKKKRERKKRETATKFTKNIVVAFL